MENNKIVTVIGIILIAILGWILVSNIFFAEMGREVHKEANDVINNTADEIKNLEENLKNLENN